MRTPVVEIACLLLAAACSRDGGAATEYRLDLSDPNSCEGCHAKINPGLLADHQASPHMSVPLFCDDCHGSDHAQIFAEKGAVPPTVCKPCHEEAYADFAGSKHGKRLREGKLDALLAAAPLPVGGCTATGGCHSIQKVYENGSVGRCSACHISHAFRNAEANDPLVCYGCHSGTDNSEYQAWLRSSHALPSPTGRPHIADCVACHGTHDVSDAIVDGVPPPTSGGAVTSVEMAELGQFRNARGIMMERCANCHGKRLAREALEKGDFWRYRGAVLLDEARGIVEGLEREGLLEPPLTARAKNPVSGHSLRLGGAQIFDQVASLPERIYYEMHLHWYPLLWRASYHTDPERIAWEYNDTLKSCLDRLRKLDRELRRKKEEREQ
jgi:hypothetical protein